MISSKPPKDKQAATLGFNYEIVNMMIWGWGAMLLIGTPLALIGTSISIRRGHWDAAQTFGGIASLCVFWAAWAFLFPLRRYLKERL